MKQEMTKILVPVDFKEPSLRAAHQAAIIARRLDVSLRLVYVIETPGILAQFFSSADQLVKITGQAKEKLFKLRASLKKETPGIKVKTRVERGKPYEKILELAAKTGVRLIILGENHQCGNPDDELGTTVYHVTLKSKVPVLTLKGDFSKMNDKVIVPLDLTKKTREQLSAALYLGLEHGTKIHLVSSLVGGINKEDSRIFKKLKEAKEGLEMNGVDCEMELFDRSEIPPFKRVLEYAKKTEAGMILLMTHQEGYTYDNYIGAFAHHILNLSEVSVLTITSLSKNMDLTPFFKAIVDPIGLFNVKGR